MKSKIWIRRIIILIGLGALTLTFPIDHARAQALLDQRIADLSKQISDGLSENQKRRIAVVEFVDLRGNVTDFGRFIAEELITRLYQTKKFTVIERQLLNKVIAEQKLSLTGVIEQSSAQRLGKVLGVDAIASGTVTDLGESVRVNARLIDTATGEVFAVASAEVVKDGAVRLLTSGTSPVQDNRIGSSPSNSDSNPTSKNAVKATVEDLVVEITECKRSRDVVLCEPRVTNTATEDRQVFLWGKTFSNIGEETETRAIDEFGTEYKSRDIALGTSNDGGIVSNTLVPHLPMKMKISFANVNPRTGTFALLRIYFSWQVNYLGNNHQFFADLRNVPIVK